MYKITIERVTTKEEERNGEWCIVDKRPYTAEEAKNMHMPNQFADELKEIRGYAPSREVVTEITQTLLKQEVEELDVSKVIKAINNL